jgi:hypothetical protein
LGTGSLIVELVEEVPETVGHSLLQDVVIHPLEDVAQAALVLPA